MPRRRTDVNLGLTLDADFDQGRKSIARDLDKIERDAKDTAGEIDDAFKKLSPELDTSDIRKALDLAGQLDGMVAEFTVDSDLTDILEAEKIARDLRRFQGRVELSVEGREELKDALGLADKLEQIRQVKVQVQGREDLEKAARLAEEIEQRRTVQVDVDDSEIKGAGNRIASELESGGERGAEGIESAVSDIDFGDLGGTARDQFIGALSAAGPWGAAAGGIAAVFGDEFLGGFSDALPAARTDLIRGLRTGLTGPELEEVGRVAADVWGSGFANGMSQSEMRDAVATVKQELGDLNEVELTKVTKEALLLSEAIGVELPEAIALAESMVARGLVGNISEGLNLVLELAQKTGAQFDEMMELVDEFGPAISALGIEGPQGFAMMAEIFERRLTPQLDQAGEIFEELNEEITNGGAAEALEDIGLNAEEMTRRVVSGGPDAAAAVSEIAEAVLAVPDPADRAAAAVAIFGGNVGLMGTEARDAILEIFTLADGTREVGTELSDTVPAIEDTATGLDRLKRHAAEAGNEIGTTLSDGLDTLNALAELDFSTAAGSAASFGEALSLKVLGPASELIDPLDRLLNKVGLDLPGAFDVFGGKAEDLPPKLANVIEKGGLAGRTFDELGTEASDAADGIDEAKAAAEQLDAALQAFSGRFDADSVMRSIEEDALAATAATKGLTTGSYDLGTGFDITTEKGRAAEAAMEGLSGNLDDLIQGAREGTVTSEELASGQARVEAAVRAVAAQMGLTKAETEDLVREYASVPSDVTTNLNAIDNATRVVQNLQAALAGLKDKTITVTTRNAVIAATAATAGKRHGGGPVDAGKTYIVGGPGAEELFTPDVDGQISDPADTRRILAGSAAAQSFISSAAAPRGGGAVRGVLEIGSDGSDHGRYLMDQLRKAVRNRGGNLDIVFRPPRR